MTYGEATPTYNSGSRKIVNYKDFLQHDKEEEQELKDMKRKFKKNELEVGNQEHMSKYNKVTHKNDDMVEDEVDDSLEAFEESIGDEVNLGYEIPGEKITGMRVVTTTGNAMERKLVIQTDKSVYYTDLHRIQGRKI